MYVVHLDLAVAYGMDPESVVVVKDGFYFLNDIHILVVITMVMPCV